MKALTVNLNIQQYVKEKKDSMVVGMCLMALTGIGILFVAAVPIVVMFGGFSNKSTSMFDGLASVGHTYIVGLIMYIVLIGYVLTKWFV